MKLPIFNFHLGGLWGIFVVLAISIGSLAYLANRYVTSYVYQNYVSSLKTEAESFELALQEGLAQHDFDLVQQLLTDLGSQRSISTIRLLNSERVVRSSSNPGEVGIQLDLSGPTCSVCHTASRAMLPFHQLIPGKEAEEPNILIANALDNRVVCQGCHNDGKLTRGVLLVEYHAQDMFNWQKNFTAGVFTSGAFVLLILFSAISAVLNFSYFRPLQRLESGKPDERFAKRSDEIGVVARRLAQMEEKLEEQEQQADNRRRNFRALVAISESLDDSISIERIYRTALSTLQEVTGFSTVAMRYYDSSQDCFRLVVQNGMSPQMVKELQCVTPDLELYRALMETRRVVQLSSGPGQDSLQLHPSSSAEGYRTTFSVPFLSGDRILGCMELGSREITTLSEDQTRWLEVVGRVIGSLQHQVDLLARLRNMAMVQERAHMAQEIHDGLVQMLGSLRLWAEDAQSALAEGNTQDAQAAVRKIETTASDAYSSLREEMLGLRVTLPSGKGLLPVVREYLMRFQRQWGIKTQLLVENQDGAGTTISFSPAVEIQLIRMIQEALTNVRRHSQAACVKLVFRQLEQGMELEISDDGIGFDQNNIPEEKLGLRIMRERADQVGGKVQVESTPGEGTRLKIMLPL